MHMFFQRVFAVFLVAASLVSCQKKVEGCLNPDANNFAFDADKSCDSCCTYPKLRLAVANVWGDDTTLFSYKNTPFDAAGKPFKIDTLAFYLSDFQLVSSSSGAVVRIADSLRLRVFPDSTYHFFQREIALVRASESNVEVGSLVAHGSFDSLKFTIGLSDFQNKIIPAKAAAGFPLRPQPENLWHGPDSAFVFLKIKLKKDTISTTPISIFEISKKEGSRALSLAFPKPASWKRGSDATIRLFVDYKKWFENVDFTQPDEQILLKIKDNLPNSFQLKN